MKNKLQIRDIYIDGACKVHTGNAGGWAVVIYFEDKTSKGYGSHIENTTNNRMELVAAIECLKLCIQFKEEGTYIVPGKCPIYSDSEYVINGLTQWVKGWKTNDWKTKNKSPVKNKDLWIELDDLYIKGIRYDVEFIHVKGHADVDGNDRADLLAVEYSNEGETTSATSEPKRRVNEQSTKGEMVEIMVERLCQLLIDGYSKSKPGVDPREDIDRFRLDEAYDLAKQLLGEENEDRKH